MLARRVSCALGSCPATPYASCSDLDVVVELPGVDHARDKKNSLFNVSGALKASGATHDVFVNHFAKVPVATFVTVPNFGAFFISSLTHFRSKTFPRIIQL